MKCQFNIGSPKKWVILQMLNKVQKRKKKPKTKRQTQNLKNPTK